MLPMTPMASQSKISSGTKEERRNPATASRLLSERSSVSQESSGFSQLLLILLLSFPCSGSGRVTTALSLGETGREIHGAGEDDRNKGAEARES